MIPNQEKYLRVLFAQLDRQIVEMYESGMSKREVALALAPRGYKDHLTPAWGIVDRVIMGAITRKEIEPQEAEAEVVQRPAKAKSRKKTVKEETPRVGRNEMLRTQAMSHKHA